MTPGQLKQAQVEEKQARIIELIGLASAALAGAKWDAEQENGTEVRDQLTSASNLIDDAMGVIDELVEGHRAQTQDD